MGWSDAAELSHEVVSISFTREEIERRISEYLHDVTQPPVAGEREHHFFFLSGSHKGFLSELVSSRAAYFS